MMEIWKAVPGAEAYQVSSLGRVKKGARIYALTRNTPNGYYRASINGKKIYVHRLVAEVFIGRGEGEVDHIDGNKINNSVENLRWVTPSENKKHSFEFPRMERKGARSPVRMITGNSVCTFNSMKAAAEATGRTRRAIYNACLDGTRCAGARWERAE